MARQAL
jgi:hypothetical protein